MGAAKHTEMGVVHIHFIFNPLQEQWSEHPLGVLRAYVCLGSCIF